MKVSRAAALPIAVSAKFRHAAELGGVAVGAIRLNQTERDVVENVRVVIAKLGSNLSQGAKPTFGCGQHVTPKQYLDGRLMSAPDCKPLMNRQCRSPEEAPFNTSRKLFFGH